MRMAVRAFIGFLVGAGLVFGLGMSLPMIVPISQAEGAYAMGVAFVWTPLGGIAGAIIGAVLGARSR